MTSNDRKIDPALAARFEAMGRMAAESDISEMLNITNGRFKNGKEHRVPTGSLPPKDGAHSDSVNLVSDAVKEANVFKEEGNKAFGRCDRQAAVEAYDCALALLTKDNNPDQRSQEWKRLAAVCYTNRSAALLLPGDGVDAERAVKDGQEAVKWDPTYAKGYYRLSKAYEHLDDVSSAQDVISRALMNPSLQDNDILVSYLIDLQTGGNGLPTDEKVFDAWLSDILSENQAKGFAIKGSWQKKWMAHKALLKQL